MRLEVSANVRDLCEQILYKETPIIGHISTSWPALCSLRWFMHDFLLAHISHVNVSLPVGHWKIGLVRGGKIHTGHSRRARIDSVSILAMGGV